MQELRVTDLVPADHGPMQRKYVVWKANPKGNTRQHTVLDYLVDTNRGEKSSPKQKKN